MRLTTFVIALLIATSAAYGQFQKGDWDLTLTGSGQSNKDFDATALSFTGGLGHFILDPVEIGIRQQVSYADAEAGSAFTGTTRAFADFHFNLGQLVPFVGFSGGVSYGDNDVESAWIVGPEGGLKFFVNESTYIFGIISYDFDVEDGFDSGGFSYGLGIGFRF